MSTQAQREPPSLAGRAITAGSGFGVLGWALAVSGVYNNTLEFLSFSSGLVTNMEGRHETFQQTLSNWFEWALKADLSWISERLLPTLAALVLIVIFGAAARLSSVRSRFNPEQHLIANTGVRVWLALLIVVGFIAVEQSYFSLESPSAPTSPAQQVVSGSQGHTLQDMRVFVEQRCRNEYAIVKSTQLDALCIFMPGSPALAELASMNLPSVMIVILYLAFLGIVVLEFQREVFAALLVVMLVLLIGFIAAALQGDASTGAGLNFGVPASALV